MSTSNYIDAETFLSSGDDPLKAVDDELAKLETKEGREALESIGINIAQYKRLLKDTRNIFLDKLS